MTFLAWLLWDAQAKVSIKGCQFFQPGVKISVDILILDSGFVCADKKGCLKCLIQGTVYTHFKVVIQGYRQDLFSHLVDSLLKQIRKQIATVINE